MGERNILVRALEFSEHPRQLEVAYVQWINLWHGEQNRTVVDIPPEALSVLTGTDIRSEAKLADGSPLPFWVTFDADARALLVNPPGNLTQKSTTVKVWFWDEKGNEAVVSITLNLKADAARSVAGAKTRIDHLTGVGLAVGVGGVDDIGQAPRGDVVDAHSGLLRSRQRSRSEERRVGKECRSRWSPYH